MAIKTLLRIGLITGSAILGLNAFAATQVIVKSAVNGAKLNASRLPLAVSDVIKTAQVKDPTLYKVIAYQYKDHYVIYLLSGKYWKATKIRVNLDANGKLTNLMEPYLGDDQQQSNSEEQPAVCPDNTIQFVVISAYPGVGEVDKAIATVSAAAKKKYKTMTILSESADAQTYKNWFSCPNLKGFYSIGHGSNSEMIVGNETIVDYSFFEQDEFINKYRGTTVILNSCELFNYPFGPQMMFGNAVTESQYSKNPGPNTYEYMGGYIDLPMSYSELASACFVAKAINGAKMDYLTLKQCIGSMDVHFQGFGLAYPGKFLK